MDKHIIINIGRQFGSGGKQVATALGERLGIAVYDRELLIKAAEKSGLSEALFKQTDERRSYLKLGGLFGAPQYGDFSGTATSRPLTCSYRRPLKCVRRI